MWVTSQVRPITFHELRHTTGSLLVMGGVPIAVVQRILRHSDVQITADTYTHLEPGYLQDSIDKLRFGTPGPSANAFRASAKTVGAAALDTDFSAPFGTRLVPDQSEGPSGPPSPTSETQAIAGVSSGAGYRVRTDDIRLGKTSGDVATGSSGLQSVETIANRGAERSHPSHRLAQNSSPFGTRLVPEFGGTHSAGTGGVGEQRLMGVREVAERLGVCTATVYRLCRERALGHIRILNTVRIAPRDLQAFLESRHQPGR